MLKRQLLSEEIKKLIEDKIKKQDRVSSKTEISDSLKQVLFKDIVSLTTNDYEKFAEIASLHLVWDFFCDIQPEGIANDLLREGQLNIWFDLWKEGHIFPFGKIMDDFATRFNIKLSNNTSFKGAEDMVDAEAFTDLIMGSLNNGEIQAVNIFTCDPITSIQERMLLGEKTLELLEKHANRILNRNFGSVYKFEVIDNNLKLIKIFSPSVPIIL